MKTLKARLNITENPRKVIDINLLPSPPSKKPYRFMDRKEARRMVIKSEVYTEKELLEMEKIGCGKIVLNQLEISPCCRLRELLAEKEAKNIIEGIKIFMTALGSEVAAVYLPKKNRTVSSNLAPLIKKSPNIYKKAVYDRYPLGIKTIFSRCMLQQTGDYFPGKGGSLIVSPEEALQLYSFTAQAHGGNSCQNICILKKEVVYYIRAKKEMTVANLLDKINVKIEGFIIEGDPLKGRSITNPKQEKITGKNLITILPRTPVDLAPECYRCGRCIEVCPVGLKIPRSRKSLQEKRGVIPASSILSCAGCGLCGYFCPGWVR